MFRIEHILTDQEARDLRDKINVHLGEVPPVDTPTPADPPINPPVDRPPEPPPLDQSLVNRTFSQIWSTNLGVPTQRRGWFGQLKMIQIRAGGVLSIAIPLPKIEDEVQLAFAKASSQVHGLRHAVLSWTQDFHNPLAEVKWGTSALRANFTKADSSRVVFLNVQLDNPKIAWDLFIQPSMKLVK